MKAITCSQCGALIKKISLKEKFAVCDYCGAKILLKENRDKIVEIPDENAGEQQLSPWEQYLDNSEKIAESSKQYDAPSTYPQDTHKSMVFWVICLIPFALVLVATIGINSVSCLVRPFAEKDKKTLKNTPAATIDRQINYQVKIQWNGKYDMEHFETPRIDLSKLPTLDEAELKKTVFNERSVQVRVTIDTTGEVSKAEAISGHPLLQEAAEKGAKKTIFNPRQKPTERTLTYFFLLVSDE